MPIRRKVFTVWLKEARRNLNLYVIIPVIFAGMSILSILLTYRITIHYRNKGLAPHWPLAFWGTLLVLFTFICGLLIVKFLIDPVRRFLSETRRLGVVHEMKSHTGGKAGDDIPGFASVFEQVTELLGKVEARQLFPEIIGQSNAMLGVLNRILKVAPTDSTVLITGETGTGKELIAQSIHRHSSRSSQPLVALNCAAIPDGLIESELFGHEKGAFTDAHARKLGKFESADGGTLFMDEIGDMPLETQAKLLRALEERHIERLGSEKPVPVNVRIIAATNRNLDEMVTAGRFRQDLFFRLNVFDIQLPSLRARLEDIPLLANHFLKKMADGDGKQISSDTHRILMTHEWPGNVRELKNAIESAAVLTGEKITPGHLPGLILAEVGEKENAPVIPETSSWSTLSEKHEADEGQDLDQLVRAFEKGLIVEALTESHGIQVRAAQKLGIKERSLWHRLKKYQIDASVFKRRS